jgi:hypothetical protein
MSQALLSRAPRPTAARLRGANEPTTRRAEAEAILRDAAFVLHLTQRVRSSIVAGQADGAGE